MERNWAGNLAYRAERIVHPTTIDELRDALADDGPFRPLGTRHSFNDLADTEGTLIATDRLPVDIDTSSVPRRGATHRRHPLRRPRPGPARARPRPREPRVAAAHLGGGRRRHRHARLGRRHRLARDAPCAASSSSRADGEPVRARARRRRLRGSGREPRRARRRHRRSSSTSSRPTTWPSTCTKGCRVGRRARRPRRGHLAAAQRQHLHDWSRTDVADQLWVKQRLPSTRMPRRDAVPPPGPRRARGRRRRGIPSSASPPTPARSSWACPGPWYERLPHFRLEFTPSARRGTAVGVPRAARRRRRGARGRARDRGPHRAAAAGVRGAHGRRRRPVAERRVRRRRRRHPLHLARDEPAVTALLPEIEAVLPVDGPPALGQGLHPAAATRCGAIPPVARLRRRCATASTPTGASATRTSSDSGSEPRRSPEWNPVGVSEALTPRIPPRERDSCVQERMPAGSVGGRDRGLLDRAAASAPRRSPRSLRAPSSRCRRCRSGS